MRNYVVMLLIHLHIYSEIVICDTQSISCELWFSISQTHLLLWFCNIIP